MTEGQRATGHPVLDRIVTSKAAEVDRLRGKAGRLEKRAAAAPAAMPVLADLLNGGNVALFAEVKRRSPGAGAMDLTLNPGKLAAAYEDGGAFAISVLTDGPFFGGSLDDVVAVKASTLAPVLRKDFVIDELQIFEARGVGADVILLIARILSPKRLAQLRQLVHDLGMTALVEVHDPSEVSAAVESGAELIGINNRDLSTFNTNLEVTGRVMSLIPPAVAVISESGITSEKDVQAVAAVGVHGVLVGEALVRSGEPDVAARRLSSVPRRSRTP